MPVSARTPNHLEGQGWLIPPEERLDRALVAGLMLEVALETPHAPIDPDLHRRHLKSRLTQSLVGHLSGRVTLDRFRTLMSRVEHWFQFYYPLMPALPPAVERPDRPAKSGAPPAASQPHPLVRQALLKEWLTEAAGQILPRRPQRKIQPDRLQDFLVRTQGRWFQLKALARDFDIDRKTAWEYLQKLQDAGLLIHNQERSAAVRYRLADNFLQVRITGLEQQLVREGWSQALASQLAQELAATAGEPFWEEHWSISPSASRREEIIASLKQVGILEVVCQSGRRKLLRLHRQWLQSRHD